MGVIVNTVMADIVVEPRPSLYYQAASGRPAQQMINQQGDLLNFRNNLYQQSWRSEDKNDMSSKLESREDPDNHHPLPHNLGCQNPWSTPMPQSMSLTQAFAGGHDPEAQQTPGGTALIRMRRIPLPDRRGNPSGNPSSVSDVLTENRRTKSDCPARKLPPSDMHDTEDTAFVATDLEMAKVSAELGRTGDGYAVAGTQLHQSPLDEYKSARDAEHKGAELLVKANPQNRGLIKTSDAARSSRASEMAEPIHRNITTKRRADNTKVITVSGAYSTRGGRTIYQHEATKRSQEISLRKTSASAQAAADTMTTPATVFIGPTNREMVVPTVGRGAESGSRQREKFEEIRRTQIKLPQAINNHPDNRHQRGGTGKPGRPEPSGCQYSTKPVAEDRGVDVAGDVGQAAVGEEYSVSLPTRTGYGGNQGPGDKTMRGDHLEGMDARENETRHSAMENQQATLSYEHTPSTRLESKGRKGNAVADGNEKAPQSAISKQFARRGLEDARRYVAHYQVKENTSEYRVPTVKVRLNRKEALPMPMGEANEQSKTTLHTRKYPLASKSTEQKGVVGKGITIDKHEQLVMPVFD